MEERLHKVLAAAGVASRREAERLIAAGQVAVDGEIVTQMGVKVDPEQHTITVAGRPVALPRRKVYVLLNKPAGYVTTRSDPHASRTVMDLVREVSETVHPVGRLDKDTEGALILSNDGDFTQLLTHPRHGVPKIYQADVEGIPGEKALDALRNGIRLEDGVTAPAYVRVLFAGGERAVLEITLHEGRKRQVRRMLDAVGHPVRHLRRVAIGPISVRGLPRGTWRYLPQKEVHALLRAATHGPDEPKGRRAQAPAEGVPPQPQPAAEDARPAAPEKGRPAAARPSNGGDGRPRAGAEGRAGGTGPAGRGGQRPQAGGAKPERGTRQPSRGATAPARGEGGAAAPKDARAQARRQGGTTPADRRAASADRPSGRPAERRGGAGNAASGQPGRGERAMDNRSSRGERAADSRSSSRQDPADRPSSGKPAAGARRPPDRTGGGASRAGDAAGQARGGSANRSGGTTGRRGEPPVARAKGDGTGRSGRGTSGQGRGPAGRTSGRGGKGDAGNP